MNRQHRRFFSLCALATWLAAMIDASIASAATINYGDFGPIPPGFSFLQVAESSGTDAVPLYGAPDPFNATSGFSAAGLDFDPKGFVAVSTGGGVDITDGQLNFTISTTLGINLVNIFEAGDFTLAGAGTAGTNVGAGISVIATATQINGANVVPFNIGFPNNATVNFDLPSNPGLVQPWSLSLNMNTAIVPGVRVTRLEITINNQLTAFSQPSSVAFIAKKQFVVRATFVPEPAGMVVGGFSLGALAVAGRFGPRRRARENSTA